MNENTSRRTWLQTLLAALFSVLAVRISPTAAAPPASMPKSPDPDPETAVPETVSYDYDSGHDSRITEYTYDSQGRLTAVTYGPGNDDPDIITYTYDV